MSKIYMATIEEDGTEHHMVWEGHENIESAKEELKIMMQMGMGIFHENGDRNYIPRNVYVYEADKPLYGYEEEELDIAALQNYVERNW